MPEVTAPPSEGVQNEEIKKPPKIIRFVVDENVFNQEVYHRLKETADALNRLGEVTSLLRAWAGQELEYPIETVDSIARFDSIKEKLGRLIGLSDRATDTITAIKLEEEPKDKLGEDEVSEVAAKFGLIGWPREEILNISITSPEGVSKLESGLAVSGAVLHDTRSPLTLVKGHLELLLLKNDNSPAKEILVKGVLKGFAKCFDNTKDCLKLLENPYPVETVNLEKIVAKFTEEIKKVKVNPNVIIDVDLKARVNWSEAWMDLLAANIAQNIEKAYLVKPDSDHFANIQVKIVERNHKKYYLIKIGDKGPGLPRGFAGFKPGLTKWDNNAVQKRSMGTGMYSHLDAIRRYGGDLTARNRFNMKMEKIGAEISILLPVSPADTGTIEA